MSEREHYRFVRRDGDHYIWEQTHRGLPIGSWCFKHVDDFWGATA